MRKWFPLIFCLFVVRVQAADALYVLNSLGETLSYYDGQEMHNDVAVLGLYPNDLLITGENLLVLNSGTASLQRFTLNDFQLQDTLSLGAQTNPWRMYQSGERLFVSLWASSQVAVVDLASFTVDTVFATGPAPQDLLASGNYLLITSVAYDAATYSYGKGRIFVYDISTLAPIDTLEVPTNPQRIIAGSDGYLHVLCTGNYWSEFGRVVRINLQNLTVVDTLEVGGSPGDMAESADGIMFLAAGGWEYEGIRGQVFTYDVATFSMLHGSDNPLNFGNGITNVVASPSGEGVWISSFETDSLALIDSSGQILTVLPTGDGPAALRAISTATETIAEGLPSSFYLSNAYPNPTNGRVNFELQLDKPGHVKLAIFDLTGKQVTTLLEGWTHAGKLIVGWDGRDVVGQPIASGTYFLQLTYAGQIQVRRFLFIK